VGIFDGRRRVARLLSGQVRKQAREQGGWLALDYALILKGTADTPRGWTSFFEGPRKGCRGPAGVSLPVLSNFYNVDVLARGKQISDQDVQLSWNIAAGPASPQGNGLRLGVA